jgi:hypothetical protein
MIPIFDQQIKPIRLNPPSNNLPAVRPIRFFMYPQSQVKIMKPAYLKIFFLPLIIAVVYSCSKSSNSNSVSCNVSFAEIGGLQADQQVEYLASVSGSGGSKISTISYQDSAGTTTIKNPAIPWTKYVNLKKGSGVMITATGKANQGDTLNVGAFSDGSFGSTTCP